MRDKETDRFVYLGRGFGLSETEEEHYLPPSQAGLGPIPTYPRYREKRKKEDVKRESQSRNGKKNLSRLER